MNTDQDQNVTAGGKGFVYIAIIISTLAISLDFASVDLALPALEQQFGLDLETVQWVINGYILAFAVLMVAGGKLADAYGRKRIFLIGMGIFAVASLLGGAAWSRGSVIGFRVLQGVGAALLWPAMIAMACAVLGDDKRALALGLIFGTCSAGNSAGPVMGGAFTEYFSWRWVLWVNVSMAIFAMLVTWWQIPKDRLNQAQERNDFAGMAMLTSGLVALLLVVYQSDDWGWRDLRTIGLAVVAVGLLGAFPWVERRISKPLVPPDLMSNREIQALCFAALVVCEVFFIVLLYFTQYGMKFLGDEPMKAGARVVQFMLSYGVVSYFNGQLCGFVGTRRLLVLGLSFTCVASILLGAVGPGAEWLTLNGSLILLGVGVGAILPTINVRAIETVGKDKAGLVSGITFMVQLAGAAVMLAINTVLFTAVSGSRAKHFFAQENVVLSTPENTAVESVLSGAGTIHEWPASFAKDTGNASHLVQQAYFDGVQVMMWFSAALVVVALVLVLRFVPRHAKPAPSAPTA